MEFSLDTVLKGHHTAITKIAFSPIEKQIVSGSSDESLLFWKLQQKSRSLRLIGHTNSITDVTFSHSGNLIASSSVDCTVRLWSTLSNFRESSALRGHLKIVRSVDFSPDDSHIVTGSDEKSLKIWSVSQKKFVTSLQGHTNWIRRALYSPNGKVIASCSDDGTIKFFDPDSRNSIFSYTSLNGIPLSMAFHSSNKYLVFGTQEGVILMLDLRKNEILQRYSLESNIPILSVDFHPEGTYLGIGTNLQVMIINMLKGAITYSFDNVKFNVNSVAFSKDGQYFSFGGTDKNIHIWKMKL